MKRIYLLLGGVSGGEDEAEVDSGGMLVLEKMLAPLLVTTKPWGEFVSLPTPNAGDKLAIIGYSGGGTRAIMWANWRRNIPIDLMVLYDPSPEWQMQAIGPNVKSVITYQNSAPFEFGLGGGIAKVAPNNRVTKIKVVPIAQQHLAVQYNETLHDETVAAIKAL
jgi:hypothetical protein